MEYIEKMFMRELDLMKSRGFVPGVSAVTIEDKAVKSLSDFYGVSSEDVMKLFNKIFK